MTLFERISWTLPGIENPHGRSAINGSLWTLPVEGRAYVMLAILGVFGALKSRFVATVIGFGILIIGFTDPSILPFFSQNERWLRPVAYFLLGVLCFKWADEIILSWRLFALAIVVLLLANQSEHWSVFAAIPLIYATLCIAYLTPLTRMDEQVGDMSYGVYIYAWPVQIFLAIRTGIDDPVTHWLVATPITLVIAFISWRLIEKPALGLKRPFMQRADQFQAWVLKRVPQQLRSLRQSGVISPRDER